MNQANMSDELLGDVLATNQELKIQEYLEKNPYILIKAIGVPDWTFNFVLPQFHLGSRYRADFIIVSGQSSSYEVTIVELKRPNARLYTKQGNLSRDLNTAQTEINNYRQWIKDNMQEFKKNLVDEIKKLDSTFPEVFDWTRRFHINSKVVIGRRKEYTVTICDRIFNMEELGISIISYDRLVDVENKILNVFNNVENTQDTTDENEDIGTDNVLFLGDEEKNIGLLGYYNDIIKREKE